MKNNVNQLEQIINYRFKNINFLKKALIHKSFDNLDNNEKLEFLGDRVLGLIIAKRLIEIYPNEREGIIDKKYANLINKAILSGQGKSFEIWDEKTWEEQIEKLDRLSKEKEIPQEVSKLSL